jgi:hypothetical protein
MRKDAKIDFARKRTPLWRVGVKWIVYFSVFGLCGYGLFFAYQHKEQSRYYPMLTAYVAQFSSWTKERKQHLQASLVKVKDMALIKKNAEQDIHFEFYTTLPNMQMSVADVVSSDSSNLAAAKKSPIAKSVAVNKPAVGVDEIEKELEENFNKKY